MSKANQKFVTADEAVSPVIGVILMVAITVVLAAVVFVLVSNLGEGSESAPEISFNKDSSARTLTVVRADSGLDWDEFTPTTTGTDCSDDAPASGAIDAGDVITISDAGTATVCTFTLTHIATNTLVYTTDFSF